MVVMSVVPILTHQWRHCNDGTGCMHCCLSCSTGRDWLLMGQTYPWEGTSMQPLASHPHSRVTRVLYYWYWEDGLIVTLGYVIWRKWHWRGWVWNVSGQLLNHLYAQQICHRTRYLILYTWVFISEAGLYEINYFLFLLHTMLTYLWNSMERKKWNNLRDKNCYVFFALIF